MAATAAGRPFFGRGEGAGRARMRLRGAGSALPAAASCLPARRLGEAQGYKIDPFRGLRGMLDSLSGIVARRRGRNVTIRAPQAGGRALFAPAAKWL